MNCLDCRRSLFIEPDTHAPEVAAHLRECPTCARFAADEAAFERRLEAALRISPQENLRERVIFAASMRRRRIWRWLAAAAVLVLTVGMGLGGWEYRSSRHLANNLVAYMAQEPPPANRSNKAPTRQLAQLTNRLGIQLNPAGLGEIADVRWFRMQDKKGGHFVIKRGDRRATVFLLPDTWLAMQHRVQVGDMNGKLIPTGRGVIAVFCPDRRMLVRLVDDMRRVLRWPA